MIHDRTRILIKTEGLYKGCTIGDRYEEAICGLELSIRQGEHVVIRGISGTHKNVLFNLLGCLERPDSGKYYFDYEDIALSEDETLNAIRRSKIGYLFRDFRLIDRLTVYRNIEVPMLDMDISREEKSERIGKALSGMGIESLANVKVCNLSNYERQLVALARAVVNDPLIIIADEPAASLDKAEADLLMARLCKLNVEGIAVLLFYSGDIAALQHSCRVITFENGKFHIDGGAV